MAQKKPQARLKPKALPNSALSRAHWLLVSFRVLIDFASQPSRFRIGIVVMIHQALALPLAPSSQR